MVFFTRTAALLSLRGAPPVPVEQFVAHNCAKLSLPENYRFRRGLWKTDRRFRCTLRDKNKVYKNRARSRGITLGVVGHHATTAGLSCERSGIVCNLKSLLPSTRIPSCRPYFCRVVHGASCT